MKDDLTLEDGPGEDAAEARDDLTAALPGMEEEAPKAAESSDYVVLARKYRPTDFSSLIGQGAMVRTLTNAFASGRLAHAFVLTGVRGVGKTTTARIIAKALNCIGPDGTGGPTVEPCGTCDNCVAIAEDRHVDVMEMDAASRTGVDNIRELIDGVRYRPVSARYKIYIIDEVHMLSRGAFNALLKTLEEPPEHVKFIFATTEIRRVPVTVLSRCQRFDLRRIDTETLARDFARIAEAEGADMAEEAVQLVARAADGSHRDGLSILDQAIATYGGQGKPIAAADIRGMLGLADRTRSFDLLEAVMAGEAPTALEIVDEDYVSGADPVLVLQDLLELVHWLTRIKLVPAAAEAAGVPEAERTRGAEMSAKLSMPALARAWQMLLKGLGEARFAPSPIQAAEMVLVRLAYAAELPTPAEAVRALQSEDAPAPAAAPSSRSGDGGGGGGRSRGGAAAQARPREMPEDDPLPEEETPKARLDSFADVIALTESAGAAVLRAQLVNNVRLVHFERGRIEFSLEPGAPPETVGELAKFLHAQTGERWMISLSDQRGADTAAQDAAAAQAAVKDSVAQDPLVKSIMATFPGARVEEVRPLDGPSAPDGEPGIETGDEFEGESEE